MSTVHLQEVVGAYTADMNGDGVFDGDTAKTADHRYGCSGIDGVAFGPEFGRKHGSPRLTVAYGVYAHSLFVVDGRTSPVWGEIRGQQQPQRGQLLSLLPQGLHHAPSGTYGWQSAGQSCGRSSGMVKRAR